MTVRNERFTSFIDEFTSSTYIMVIVSGPDIEEKLITVNIKAARDYFENIIKS
jgi:Ras-related GTP-binding protein A/B